MSRSEPQLRWLGDARLAPLALSALPAWLWRADASRILWANPAGAAIFGATGSTAIANRKFDTGQPAAAQIAQLATRLPADGSQRLEHLRGFGAGVGRALACSCSRITLADGTPAILVVAAERAGPDFAFNEQVRRLLAECDEAIAAFAPEGNLVHATPAAALRLNGATSLAVLDGLALAADANRTGHAEGDTVDGPIAIDRIVGDAGTVLLATFRPPVSVGAPTGSTDARAPDAAEATLHAPAAATAEAQVASVIAPVAPVMTPSAMPNVTPDSVSPPTAPPTASEPPPTHLTQAPAPAERRHPLRFVWQLDEEGRFTLSSDEFIELIGPRTAAALGRPWQEIAADLALDPEGCVAHAIATRETWSGLAVDWPIDDGNERLTVELSGLPAFDRTRVFRGYRGFGVCRDLMRIAQVMQRRQNAPTADAPAIGEPTADTIPSRGGDLSARSDAPSPAMPPPAMAAPAENVVPFRAAAAESNGPTLSPIERRAFRELSRRLTQHLSNPSVEPVAAVAITDDVAIAPATPIPAGVAEPAITAAVRVLADAQPSASVDPEVEPDAPITTGDARAFLDRLPLGVLVYRLNHLIYANRAFLRWSGYQRVEALAEAGGLDSLYVEPGAISFETGGEQPFEISSSRDDKAKAEGRLFLVPWEGESAFALVTIPLTGTPVAASDRDERAAAADDALAQTQAELTELSAILDTATDGVVLLDRAGAILSCNRSAEALFGYGTRELAGRNFLDLFAPESMDVASEYLDGLGRDGTARLLDGGREVIGRVRQGGLIPLFMTLGQVGDGAAKLCAVFRDVTHWKKVEEELIDAKRQAEKASSAKSDFLAKISHEIRTPLNAIIGFSEVMMEERFGPIANERYRAYVNDIHTSGEHLISLVNDLLDLSKIEAGKLELTFAGVALNDLTQQCVAIMQPQANRERIIIRTSLAPNVPQIVADARSVRQIVLNLLSNSIKFTTAGGQVIVSTALTDLGEVALRVRDTGVGMSEKDIETALEPFRQLATSPRAGGTGLGLPLTKALAEANRASFRIKSAPNEGTLVEIAFPATRVLAG